MTFEEFVHSPLRNMHVKYDNGNLELYVRKSLRPQYNVLIDIGSANARNQHTGSFKRFLNQYDHIGFFFENVLNDTLPPFYKKRGYHLIGEVEDAEEAMAKGLNFPCFWCPTIRDTPDRKVKSLIDHLVNERSSRYPFFAKEVI